MSKYEEFLINGKYHKCCGTCDWCEEDYHESTCEFPLPEWLTKAFKNTVDHYDGMHCPVYKSRRDLSKEDK